MTIAAVVMAGGPWTLEQSQDGKQWTVRCKLALDAFTQDGDRLARIEGADLRLLTLAGFPAAHATEFVYPAGEGGAAPSAQEVAKAILQWSAGVLKVAQAEWVGKTVALTVG